MVDDLSDATALQYMIWCPSVHVDGLSLPIIPRVQCTAQCFTEWRQIAEL